MSSDTPRTDVEPPVYAGFPSTVSRDFARTLERELAALRAEYETAVTTGMAYAAEAAALRAERDRLAQALRIIAGLEQCIDNTLGNVEIARRALGEEETK